jgi:hypothetical protein
MVRTLDPERSDISQLLRSFLGKLMPFGTANSAKLPLKQQKIVVGLLFQQAEYQSLLQGLK